MLEASASYSTNYSTNYSTSYLVILNLGTGSWRQGFPAVIAQLWAEKAEQSPTPMQFTGSLPPAPHLETLYLQWRSRYESLYSHLNWRRRQGTEQSTTEQNTREQDTQDTIGRRTRQQNAHPDFEFIEFEPDQVEPLYFSQAEFDDCCRDLQQHLNQWLNSETFRPIERHLRTRLSPTDRIRIIVIAQDTVAQGAVAQGTVAQGTVAQSTVAQSTVAQGTKEPSSNISVLRLPWSLWDFLTDYPQAEIALGAPEYARSLQTTPRSSTNQVRILAIVGNAEGINVTQDQEFLQQLPQAKIDWLIEPKIQLVTEQLWQTGYDILFFAGHSSAADRGYIYLNATDRLSIEQLKYGLRTAIAQGLKLAIFNSCDGLELARALAELYIPQVIIMREPVPDRVAQSFLKFFLAAFTSGESLYLAVRHAREQLQAIETEFPCATWLPVICQNPAELPPLWQDWCAPKPKWRLPSRRDWRTLLLTSTAIAASIIGVRWFGGLQASELWAFDQLMQLRPAETPDDRLLIVKITEADSRNQSTEVRKASLSDRTLNQLLDKLEQHQPRVIGLDLYRDFPATDPALATRLQTSQRIVPVCKRLALGSDPDGVMPPPEVPIKRVGFSDFVQDIDRSLRRQLLFMSAKSTSPCSTPYALSTQLVLRYLQAQGITPSFTPQGDIKLDQTIIRRLSSRASGYQSIDARGSQILLNYRAAPTPDAIAPQVTLSQVLRGDINPAAIQNRIVLIGVAIPYRGDYWTTPYGNATDQRLPGVLIHAQMVSQLLSAVLDRRPLLWTWTTSTEVLWITAWALTGSAIAWYCRPIMLCSIGLGVALSLLCGSCLLILLQGGWIPLVPAALALILSSATVLYIFKPIPVQPGIS